MVKSRTSEYRPGGAWRAWLLALLVVVVGCSRHEANVGSNAAPAKVNTTDPQWVVRLPAKPKVAVVFVHGIFGDTLGTWQDGHGHSFFEFLRTAPGLEGKADIFAFGFTSRMFKDGSLDIREAANKLEATLTYHGIWDYDTVVFVGHSMGGLIVLEELVDRREHLEKVPLLVLYATPQEGSNINAIARVLANNPALAQMYPADASEYLKALDDDWDKIPEADRPTVICAYEKMPTYGVQIVGQFSATRFCNDAKIAIGGTDHITIVKPDRPEHDSVITLVNALKKYVFGASPTALLEMPDFVPEQDVLVYEMRNPFDGTARLVNNGARKVRYTLSRPSSDKLLVLPPTPREIAARHDDELKFYVLARGAPQSEYRFQIESATAPARTVVVRIPDAVALATEQRKAVEAVAAGVSARLGAPGTIAQLAALPPDQQQEQVVAYARDALLAYAPKLPAGADWLATADVLLSAGWAELGKGALRRFEADSPDATGLPAAQWLASATAAMSGEREVFLRHPSPAPIALDLALEQAQAPVGSGNLALWSDLSARMHGVPALRNEAWTLDGDVLRAQGDDQAAGQAYLNASKVRADPLIQYKLDAQARRIPGGLRPDAATLEGVRFQDESHALTPGARASLDATVEVLAAHPDYSIDLSGVAAADEGTGAAQRALVEGRTRAVRDYLIHRGVDAGRIGVSPAPAADRAAMPQVELRVQH